jgi:transcription-repair coupling factor (superfamily II helicase)
MKMIDDLQELLKTFEKTYDLGRVASFCAKGTVDLTGLNGSSKSLFIASFFQSTKKGMIIVTRSNRDASDFYTDLSHFVSSDSLHLFPSRETLPYDESEPLGEITAKRIVALARLACGKAGIFVLPVRTFIDYFIPKRNFSESFMHIQKGETLPYSKLKEALMRLGYVREDRVSVQGSYALRGDIFDVFICGSERPFRVELFDDTVESIREFSPLSQRSLEEIEDFTLLPAREIVLTSARQKELKDTAKDAKRILVNRILSEGLFHGIENYVSTLFSQPDTVLDYAGEDYTLVVDSVRECSKQVEFFRREAERIFAEKKDHIPVPPPEEMGADFSSLLSRRSRYINIALLPENNTFHLDFEVSERTGYRGQIRHFKEDIEDLLRSGYTVFVGAGYEGQTKRIRELLKEFLSAYENLKVRTLDLHEGFRSGKLRVALILDREIFSRKKRYQREFLVHRSEPIEGLLDIREGEHIVHVEHGIGVYHGIEKLKTEGVEKDFFKIEYRDGDEIFIPVDQIHLLQKYIGQEGRTPRIDKLGSGTWKKIKEHVKKSVKNLAKDLIGIYSARSALKGYAFSKDTEWQYEFESGFRYEETADQLRTIEELKNDMESEMPMDRLICGDVGFGKTEVAIRVAFKAVMDGKQVAVLVPTTILAEQHLNTFGERFSLYPINVEMLSRFKTPKEQKIIIENLKNGLIDVVIGTHRLIQKDVQFKDLGLVIIDEEQRFGVEHKERLKQLRTLVDVITMTATPIPRTLYMSMTKIRDMSIIETPPRDRMPIETYVIEQNDEIIEQAIRREVERGGQVYYVHNRVRTIEEKTETLRERMPDISFEIAHGQLEERELEEIMNDFFNMQFQVLVTTTIIESGLDIPNVNTIIIERADRFGLSQLYQLRGRVGRSKRKAYAYLSYPVGRLLTEQAQKRLAVINDHTALGSGFSIALKDLEIRGAGNILGREQHGEILTVGFEMYVKLLDEAIYELQHGKPPEPVFNPVIDVRFKGFIPPSYIESETLRLEIYKRLAQLESENELDELHEELRDRFGLIPEELLELLTIVQLRILCKRVGIRVLREKENELQLTFEKSTVDILQLIAKINKNRRIYSISPREKDLLHIYKVFRDNKEKYDFLKDLFDYEKTTGT